MKLPHPSPRTPMALSFSLGLCAAIMAVMAAGAACAQEATTAQGGLTATQKQASLDNSLLNSRMGVTMIEFRLAKLGECSARGLMYAPARASGNGGCAALPEPPMVCACSGGTLQTGAGTGGSANGGNGYAGGNVSGTGADGTGGSGSGTTSHEDYHSRTDDMDNDGNYGW